MLGINWHQLATHKMTDLPTLFGLIDDWFKDLKVNHPITQFNLNDDLGSSSTAVTTKLDDEETHLDSLAKDLEFLLEGEHIEGDDLSEVKSQEQETCTFYPTDELALQLDPSLGQCLTIENGDLKNRSRNTTHQSSDSSNEYSKVMASYLSARFEQEEQIQQRKQCDLKNSNSTIQTPMPRDHDYLEQIKPNASKTNTRQPQRRSKYTTATGIKNEVSTVLNTGVIKRFARYSERLRLLSGH